MTINKSINIYTCGPTLSSSIHIGAYRIFLLSDFVKRIFISEGNNVNHAMNIMDFDDTIMHAKTETNFETNSILLEFEDELKYLSINVPDK